MSADWTTFVTLGLLVIVSIMLVATLRQALGERGRAGVGRIVDAVAAVIITMRGTQPQKEEKDVPERTAR